MAGTNIDQVEAGNMLAASLGLGSGYVATTTPLLGRLMTANGSSTANGTEVTDAGGSTYTPQRVDNKLAAVSAAATSNNAEILWTLLPTCTVTGLELWDSAGTPKRKWQGPLTASKPVTLGDSLSIAIGALVISMAG